MTRYLLRRLALAVPVLIGIVLVTFVLGRLIPGDPCTAQLGEKANPTTCAAFERRFGLNEPIPVQFVIYFGNILRADLGESIQFGRPVSNIIAERLPTTLELTLVAIIFAVVVGVPLGIISAYKHNSLIDVMTMLGANIGVSMPVFWLGLMLAYIFAVAVIGTPFEFLQLPPGRTPSVPFDQRFYAVWGLAETAREVTPIMEFFSRFTVLNAILTLNGELFVTAIRHLILPAVAVGTIPLSIIARMTRSSLLEVLNQDYIRTARSKGLKESTVVLRHAVSNALLPVVTIIGLNFGFLISGAVLTETVFSLTGIGKTLFEAITARDYSIVQGVTLITAFAFVIINLLVDLLYGYLDPRIRYD